jgi:hypothetical protein
VSDLTRPPGPIVLRGDAPRAVGWTVFKKSLRVETADARARGLCGSVEVVPVRTFAQRGWALMLDRPSDHQAVLHGADGRSVTVDLRPGRHEPAPIREFDRDGQTWHMAPADLGMRYRTISTIAPYRPHDPARGWFGSSSEGGFLVTKQWTELTVTATGPEPHQHDVMIVRCERASRLTGWHTVAEGRDQAGDYRESSGLVTPAYRQHSAFGRDFDRWLTRAALWSIRDEDPSDIAHIDVTPGSLSWEAYFAEMEALKAERAR